MTAAPGISGATGLTGEVDRTSSSANLKKAGQKFESMFTGMMLKSMREAKLADPLFSSKAIDTFTEMSDAKVAAAMAEHQPLGIGRAMTDFLAKSQKGTDFPAKSQAATSAGSDKPIVNPGGATTPP